MKFKAACQERQAEKSVLTKNTKNDKSGFGITTVPITFAITFVGNVVERLKRRACDQHGLGLNPTRAILNCVAE